MDQMMTDRTLQNDCNVGESQSDWGTSSLNGTSLELLEQHQAKEQARLLHRFKELREWQQQQQQQLMMQQQQQLTNLQYEQIKVQSLLAANQQSGGRALRPNAARSNSPVMTPPCKPRPRPLADGGRGGNKDLVGHSTTAGISMDSGLVSMQDTLKSQSSLPKPVMYVDPSQSNNLPEEDKYTNSELFSNPGSRDDADDFDILNGHQHREVPPAPDWMSDTSENFVPPKLPPPRPLRGGVANNVGMKLGKDKSTADQLAGLEQLLSTAPAGLLQKMLTLLPKTSDSISSDVPPINRIVENSASPALNGPRLPSQSLKQPQQPGLNQQPLLHSQQHRQPVSQPSYERGFTQNTLHPDEGLYRWKQPFDLNSLKGLASSKFDRMSDHDFSHNNDPQYVPRAVMLNGVIGEQKLLEVNDEEDEGVEDDDDDQSEDEEEDFDEDQEDTSQNITAKEVKIDDEEGDRPIQGTGGAKSFEKLLEEQLREEEEKEKRLAQTSPEDTSAPRCRPFLRKGEGIARFNSAPKKPPPRRQEKRMSGDIGRSSEGETGRKSQSHTSEKGKSSVMERQSKEKSTVAARLKSQATRKVSAKDGKYNAKGTKPSAGDGGSPLSAPAKLTLIRNAANRKMDEHRSRQKEESNGIQGGGDVLPDGRRLYQGLEESPAKSVDDHDSTELDSLAEFELLEDVADNMSFCSNSSLVRKLVCSDAKDHQEAVKKLQTITESRKQQIADKPSNPTLLTHLTSNGTSHQEGMDAQRAEFGRESSLNFNVNNNCSNSNNAGIQNSGNVGLNNLKSKIDNIIVAKPVDISSSSEVTLTDSSSDDDSDGNEEEKSHKNEGTNNDIKNTNLDSNFIPGYFSQPGYSHHQQNSAKSISSSQSSTNPQGLLMSMLNTANPPAVSPLSPQRPIPRKVASMTTKVSSANDTLSMLQALSKKAGFLFADSNAQQFSAPLDEKSQTVQSEVALNGYLSEMQSYNLENLGARFGEKLSVNTGTTDCVSGHGPAKKQMGGNETDDDDQDFNYVTSDDDNDDDDDKIEKKQTYDPENRSVESKERMVSNHQPQAVVGAAGVNGKDGGGFTNGFDDEAEWFDDDEGDNETDDNNPLVNCKPNPTNIVTMGTKSSTSPSTPPTSKLVTKLFPKLKPPVTKAIAQIDQVTVPVEGGSVGAPVDGVTNRVLRDKLMELETEIERFRSENSNLDRLRREREEGLIKLKHQIEMFEKEKEAELKRLDEFKTEEMKKLKRERKLFETYQKKVRSMPDKKEREEIENLKAQLEEVQDELKRKESRWTSTVSRLKNRLAEAEMENGELKEEVRILEKKRLEWMTAQSQSRTLSSSAVNQGKSAYDLKSLSQESMSSSSQPPRSSTPTETTEEPKPVLPTSTGGKKSGAVKMTNAPISLRTAVPAVTSSSTVSKTRSNQGQSKTASKTLKPGVVTNEVTANPSTSQTVRTSGESLPIQNTSVPVMMEEITPFAQITRHEPSAAVGTLTSSSSVADKSAAMQAMEKAVIDKENPMEFVENVHSDGKVEKLYKNGAKEVRFPNGTIKEISSDGQTIVCRLANGDIRQIFPDHRVVYIFNEAQIMQTTFPDGLETFQFKNGQIERRYPDGTVEITFPSKDVKYIFPDGGQEVRLVDGTVMTYSSEGERTVEYPSGDREVHTADYQRREFPDGIVKTIYSDGRHETRFPNGRVRMRDKAGNVIMDQICYR